MNADDAKKLLKKQSDILLSASVNDEPNRQGLRARTEELLEHAFLDLAARFKPDTSIEIGAHEANFSRHMETTVPGIRTLAFEANPYVFKIFSEQFKLESTRIDYRHLAICGQSGDIAFHIPRAWPKGTFSRENPISSILPRNSEAFEYEMVRVPAAGLDDAVQLNDIIDCVIWIDVEGAQHDVIETGPKVLSNTQLVFMEVETEAVWKGQKTVDAISSALANNGLFPIMRDNAARMQYNQVYARLPGRYDTVVEEATLDFIDKLMNMNHSATQS